MKQRGPEAMFYCLFSRYCILRFAILCLLLTACNGSTRGQSATEVPSVLPMNVPTVLATPPPTPTLTGPQWNATQSAGLNARRYALQTKVASGIPFRPTPIVVPTIGPVLTPATGINGDCAQGNSLYYYYGCWAGFVNGEYIFVNSITLIEDPEQAQLRVYTMTADLLTYGVKNFYSTPSRVGGVYPTEATWPLITLATRDRDPQVTFVFDISTRQWVSPTPQP
jgi:hypothetical protein